MCAWCILWAFFNEDKLLSMRKMKSAQGNRSVVPCDPQVSRLLLLAGFLLGPGTHGSLLVRQGDVLGKWMSRPVGKACVSAS